MDELGLLAATVICKPTRLYSKRFAVEVFPRLYTAVLSRLIRRTAGELSNGFPEAVDRVHAEVIRPIYKLSLDICKPVPFSRDRHGLHGYGNVLGAAPEKTIASWWASMYMKQSMTGIFETRLAGLIELNARVGKTLRRLVTDPTQEPFIEPHKTVCAQHLGMVPLVQLLVQDPKEPQSCRSASVEDLWMPDQLRRLSRDTPSSCRDPACHAGLQPSGSSSASGDDARWCTTLGSESHALERTIGASCSGSIGAAGGGDSRHLQISDNERARLLLEATSILELLARTKQLTEADIDGMLKLSMRVMATHSDQGDGIIKLVESIAPCMTLCKVHCCVELVVGLVEVIDAHQSVVDLMEELCLASASAYDSRFRRSSTFQMTMRSDIQ